MSRPAAFSTAAVQSGKSGNTPPHSTELQTLSPGLGMPSIDPLGLAVHCLLRFQFVGFRPSPLCCGTDSLTPVAIIRQGCNASTEPSLLSSSSAAAAAASDAKGATTSATTAPRVVTGSGFWGIHALLKANGFDVDSSLLTKHAPLAPAVELVATTLADAVVTLIVLDEGLRRELRKSEALKCQDSSCSRVSAVLGTLKAFAGRVVGEPMTPVERQLVERGRSLPSLARGGVQSRNANDDGKNTCDESELLVQVAEKSITSLRGLREMCATSWTSTTTTGASHRNVGGAAAEDHFLATALPTSADCFAYAALSFLVHSDLSAASGTALKRLRQFVYTSSPSLVTYTETLRARYFSQDATKQQQSSYELRPVEVVPPGAAPGQDINVYRPGRLRALLFTGVFAFFYFVVVNADTVLQLLGATEEGEESGDGSGREPAPTLPTEDATGGARQQSPSSTSTSPP